MSVSASSPLSATALEGRVRGRIVTPDDRDYDAVRTVVAGHIDRRPAFIVRVADAADVAEVIGLARETGAELAIRSGGHSGAGHSATDGGIVLDLRDLSALELDVEARTAWADSGVTAAAFTDAAGEHGLAVGFGDTGSVGLGGLTLGGGVGYLVRLLGLTIDSLLAADVVTADGQLRRVDADTEPDLFWAIRGGGGNFGVATRFLFKLSEIPEAYGGMLILPATPEVIEGYMAASSAAPNELSSILNVMPAPPMPGIPEEAVGQIVAMAIMCYAGDPSAGERAVAPFRALAEPLMDGLKPMRYPEIYMPEDPEYRPLAEARTMFIERVDAATAELILERLAASDSPMRVAQLRPLGGVMADVPVDATAFAHRTSRIMVNVAAFYAGDADRPHRRAWVTGFADDLRQGDDGAYVNFLVDEGEQRIRAAYPGATWERLRAIKAQYDPTNLFRLNQNIPPAD
ncbi:MAG TPA: FAD-binding oxidoreductase [Candidatus Limnocylindria bacterium]|nr:FAD-binding oxidoreductase [Candidatus Limnocylindria bacterium]